MDSWLCQTLVHLVHLAANFRLRDKNLEAVFIGEDAYPLIADIGIDNPSEMRLGVGIEEELGVSIVPVELDKLEFLEPVLARIWDSL